MRILNKTRATVIAERAVLADTFGSKLIGLLGKKEFPSGRALVITGCQSIHMFFMKFPIDAIFVSNDNRVVGILPALKPFSISPIYWKSSYVVEAPVGVITQSKTAVGDEIRIQKTEVGGQKPEN